jgi:hypothetical protein
MLNIEESKLTKIIHLKKEVRFIRFQAQLE